VTERLVSTTPPIIVLMGVAGAGKSTVGRALADDIGWPFIDADDYHSPSSRAKLTAGIPLTDADRLPWLHALNRVLRAFASRDRSAVVACSALTASYRRLLAESLPRVQFVYLRATPDTIRRRLATRTHFFNPGLVADQFKTLEEPANALVVDADASVEEIARHIRSRLRLDGMARS
jgi:gluconokinase